MAFANPSFAKSEARDETTVFLKRKLDNKVIEAPRYLVSELVARGEFEEVDGSVAPATQTPSEAFVQASPAAEVSPEIAPVVLDTPPIVIETKVAPKTSKKK